MAGCVIGFITTHTEANLKLDGLTIQNGYGGVEIEGWSVNFTNNIIKGNERGTSGGSGGGAYIHDSGSIVFTNNTITDNKSGRYDNLGRKVAGGGGVYAGSFGPITFTNNTIKNNLSSTNGGGAYVNSDSAITLTNNTITENLSLWSGGGVRTVSYYGTINLTNNTIIQNSGDIGVGGLSVWLRDDKAVLDVINNIIWGNTSEESINDLYIDNYDEVSKIINIVNLYNNDFDQSDSGTYIKEPFPIDPSNLDNEDPLFVDAPSSDYHLTGFSPCIDTGRLEGAPSEDMDGDPRPLGAGVDIGADEFNPSVNSTTTTTTSTTITTTLSTTTTVKSSTTTIDDETTTTTTCRLLEIYGERSEEVALLRYYRDNVLNQTPEGQEIIRLYYEWGPVIFQAMREDEEFNKDMKEMIDEVLELIEKTVE